MTTTICAESTGSITAAAGVADTVKFSAPWGSVRIVNLSGNVFWARADGQTAVAGASGCYAILPGIPFLFSQNFDGLGANTLNPISIISASGGAYSVEGVNFAGGLAGVATLNDTVSGLTASLAGRFRTLQGAAGTWVRPEGPLSSATGTITASARLTAAPLFVPVTRSFDKANMITVTTAPGTGSTVQMGIYQNGSNDTPGALLQDFGSVASNGTVGSKEISISLTLQPGLYWLAQATLSVTTAGTFRTISSYAPVVARGDADFGGNSPFYGMAWPGSMPSEFAMDLSTETAAFYLMSLRLA